ncbi:NAD(P)/FAD-dependent oxidoreductase [Halorarius halobius]|uniref:NAD(P)/FAD-dependent oxidoreductase n=1 Tax=Halorarius halobius TaxID=2962671 RepID=UPI0020CBAFFD|nr:NAD(P)/FAD-dependent oxidoreductase [Halorarius halobius]
MDVAIAGAGLSGLVAAARLAEAGHDVTVYEERDEVGGRVRSTREDGYVFDRGFQVLFTGYPAVQRELDLDALNLGQFVPGATLARPNHRSTLADPLREPALAVDTLLNRDVQFRDKLATFRLQRELAGRDPDAILDGPASGLTIEAYLADRGFSRAYVERFVAPFYGGITLDRSLSTSAAVFEYTYKMLSEGKIALPAGGMGAVPEQLADRARAAGATVELGANVTAVEGDDDGATLAVSGETVEADAAIVATDPKAAGELTAVDTPTDAKGCVTLHFSLPDHQSLRTDRRIVLNSEDDRPNTVSPSSSAQPSYAPDGEQLLVANFLGRQTESDDELATEAREALESWYPEARFDELELRHTDRVEFAQFPQPPGFRADLPAPDAPEGNVLLAGDYTRWCSIQGAMESGRVAAGAVEEL